MILNDAMTTKEVAELWAKAQTRLNSCTQRPKGSHRLHTSLFLDPLRLIRQVHMGGANAILRR